MRRSRMTAVILMAVALLGRLRSAEPTPEEITGLCRKIEDHMKIGDPKVLAEAMDLNALLDRALEGLELPQATRERLQRRLHQEGLTFQFATKIVTEVKQGGAYRFLRVHTKNGSPRALFRLNSRGGLNWHDLVFAKDSAGQTRIPDMYVFVSGENLSQTLRRTFLPIVARENRSWLEKMLKRESEYIQSAPTLNRFVTLGNQGKVDEALKVYPELPKSVREERFVLLARITFLATVIENDERYVEMYTESTKDFLRLYPNDANVNLLLIDHHILRKAYDEAFAALERVDESVGGDPYLNLIRGNIRCLQNRYPEGRALLRKTMVDCPDRPEAYFGLLEQSMAKRDFATTSWTLDRLRENLGVEYADMETHPLFAEYVKSPEYEEWIQRQKASPADDGEVSPKD